ncbi:MAG: hypothetical protein HS115_06250 [Spirochaetales bacterium]|nr:hypothetical protein [Spirochaetales bacterium]
MNDLQTLVRYIIPAALSILELALLLTPLESGRCLLAQIPDLSGTLWGAAIITILLVGYGYFLQMIYRTNPWMRVDHRDLVEHLIKKDYLAGDQRFDFKNPLYYAKRPVIEPRAAWVIVNAEWHMRSESNPAIKGATKRSESLSDMMHGAGASLIGFLMTTFFAAIFILCATVWRAAPEFYGLLITVLIGCVLLGLHFVAFRNTQLTLTRFVEIVLIEALKQEKSKLKSKGN